MLVFGSDDPALLDNILTLSRNPGTGICMPTAGISFPRLLTAINLLNTRAITNIAKGKGFYRHKSFSS